MVLVKSNNFSDIEKMYFEYFPANELKDVALLQSLITSGKASLLLLKKAESIAAFAFVCDSGDYCLIDYLAVSKEVRGGGVGSALIKKIHDYYPNKKGIVLEIEALGKGDSKSENNMRVWRKAFYLKNGVLEGGFNVVLNKVEMEVLLLPISSSNITEIEYITIYYNTFTKEFTDGYVLMCDRKLQ